MDASFGPNKLGTNEAHANEDGIKSRTSLLPLSDSVNEADKPNQSIKHILKVGNRIYQNHDLVSAQYIKRNNETKPNECTVKNYTTQGNIANVTTSKSPVIAPIPRSIINPDVKDNWLIANGNDYVDTNKGINPSSIRSASSPQLTIKPLTRSKVYRKASLKSMNLSNSALDHTVQSQCKFNIPKSQTRIINISNCSVVSTDSKIPVSYHTDLNNGGDRANDVNDTKNKWSMGEVHITCNPLSTPYPYSTPHHAHDNVVTETMTGPVEDEPKSRSCGNFLPILSLIPQTVIGFQYLSPKMKFSWWRNKIS
ncbi:uncharacterized protein LOC108622386 [Ceratina calcarata]|uniref:Uncharacterized protein LOC108622386 n=1 Tax=Ceratina calcarata TaxID=156304 RepID=A0AAJ7IRZ9_9HYME|nr:uncharacterized protein LOC108622386 [Ceratina calcarata]